MDDDAADRMGKMERDLERIRRDDARVHAQVNVAVAGARSAFDAYRASFSSTQLREPETISSQVFRNAVQRVPDQTGAGAAAARMQIASAI